MLSPKQKNNNTITIVIGEDADAMKLLIVNSLFHNYEKRILSILIISEVEGHTSGYLAWTGITSPDPQYQQLILTKTREFNFIDSAVDHCVENDQCT
jgi:hypothetical protein